MVRLQSGMNPIRRNAIRSFVALAFVLSGIDCAAAQSAPPAAVQATQLAPSLRTKPGAPFVAEDRALIARRVLADPKLAEIRSHRVRVLTVVPSVPEKDEPQRQASTILFDYTQGRAYRARLDLGTGAVTRLDALPGRPQPSTDEIAEASAIVARDPVHARLMKQGAVLEGGFAVDGPRGTSSRDRFVQFHLVTADRMRFLREVTVDLTAGKIAASVPRQ